MEYFFPKHCNSFVNLNGKTVVITGCNTGIGKETARDFYKRGARVIMACRSASRTQVAIDDIKKSTEAEETDGELVFRHLELAFLTSVRKCASEILDSETRIDILINNAGVMLCPKTLSEDGYELHFATNHLGHFLFTLLLLPRILRLSSARIINVSSSAHNWGDQLMHFEDINLEKNYTPTGAYGRSKLANILFTVELAKRLKNTGVNVYAVNPGVVHTELYRYADQTVFPGATWLYNGFTKYILKTPQQGCQTTLYCALDRQCSNETGLYYSDCKNVEPISIAKDQNIAKELWDVSCKLVKLDSESNYLKAD